MEGAWEKKDSVTQSQDNRVEGAPGTQEYRLKERDSHTVSRKPEKFISLSDCDKS